MEEIAGVLAALKQNFFVAYTGWGYELSILYNKVRFFDAVQKVSHNAAAVADAISIHTP